MTPAAVPEPDVRAASLHWAPEEDALIESLYREYGNHWNLIADVFNSRIVRPTADNRLPWDCYDRWNRRVGPGSRKILPDGTDVRVAPPEYSPAIEKASRSHQFSSFEGAKKGLRHLTLPDAIRKVQKKREAAAAKAQASSGRKFLRRVELLRLHC